VILSTLITQTNQRSVNLRQVTHRCSWYFMCWTVHKKHTVKYKCQAPDLRTNEINQPQNY